jgi:hypothetical protein
MYQFFILLTLYTCLSDPERSKRFKVCVKLTQNGKTGVYFAKLREWGVKDFQTFSAPKT